MKLSKPEYYPSFAKQCTLVSINSVLPCEFTYMADESVQSIISVYQYNINNISVRMIKLCTNSVAHPLTLIFRNSMTAGKFATQWKRANIVPLPKKNDKEIISHYRPVSLLPISSKVIFNKLFKYFEKQKSVI